jgi:hypothetical protein
MRSTHCSAERHVHVDQLQLSPLPGEAVDGFDQRGVERNFERSPL